MLKSAAALAFAVACQTRPEAAPTPATAAPTPTALSSAVPTPEPAPVPEAPATPAAAPEAAPVPEAAPRVGAQQSAARDQASEVTVSPAPCRVALIGDSLTDARVGGGGFVRYLEKRCKKSTFTNFAKGGAMVNQMRRHFESVVLAEPAGLFTHMLVFGGVNDLYSDETAGRTPAKIEADLSFMIQAGKQRGWRVVALTVAPWGGFTRYFNARRSAATRELNDWILEQGRTKTIDGVVDAWSLLSCGDPERLCPEYEPPFKDGLHFGTKGHERLGQALYETAFKGCS